MAISLSEPVGRQQAHTPHTDKQIKPDEIGFLENVIWPRIQQNNTHTTTSYTYRKGPKQKIRFDRCKIQEGGRGVPLKLTRAGIVLK